MVKLHPEQWASQPQKPLPPMKKFLKCHVRHLILLLSTICLMLIFSNSILLNFTIICMDPAESNHNDLDTKCPHHSQNLSKSNANHTVTVSQFSPLQRSALFSATAIGAIVGGFPINMLVDRFSLRVTISVYGFVSALSTLATPIVFSLFGFPALLIARVFQGVAYPAECVTNSAVTRKWAPIASAGTFLMLISSHFQFGPMLSMPLAAHFCQSSWGWPGIYYVNGVLTFIFFILFFMIFRDNPSQHPWISDAEIMQIQKDKPCDGIEERRDVPYRAILSDWVVWLQFVAIFSDEIGYQIYTQLGPYYLNKVLCIGVAGTGFFAALPYVISAIFKVLGGPLNDRLLAPVLSESSRIMLFSGISQYGIALSLACLAFIPLVTNSLWLIVPFYATLNMFTGLDFLGIWRSLQTISLRHSELLVAWASIMSSCVALVLPLIVGTVAPSNSRKQWMLVLGFIALVLFICITVFIIFGKTAPRKWAIEWHGKEHSIDKKF